MGRKDDALDALRRALEEGFADEDSLRFTRTWPAP